MNNKILETDPVVLNFINELKKKLYTQIKTVILFGSRARGDYKKYSDYDFLIVLNNKNLENQDWIAESEYTILNTMDYFISSVVMNQNEWEANKNFPIGKNILKDGIIVWN